ncbi:MAG: transposase [Ferruginibacter sp.]|nr:transposase [Ferruginibacter sp.]
MGKRTRKSPQEKQRILEESKTLGLVETARKYEISYQALKNWQGIYAISGLEGLAAGAVKVSPELKRLQLENQRLKELVADKELELKIKNELLKKTSSNKLTGK